MAVPKQTVVALILAFGLLFIIIVLLTVSEQPPAVVVFKMNVKLLSLPVWLSGKLKVGFWALDVLVSAAPQYIFQLHWVMAGLAAVVLLGLILAGAQVLADSENAGLGCG